MADKIRILHVVTSLETGGMENGIINLCNCHNRDVFQLMVCCLKQTGKMAERLKKDHTKVQNAYEMQSSNSSDALLMNIFCHPKLNSWKGIRNLFGVSDIKPEFGIQGLVLTPTPTAIPAPTPT